MGVLRGSDFRLGLRRCKAQSFFPIQLSDRVVPRVLFFSFFFAIKVVIQDRCAFARSSVVAATSRPVPD